VKRKKEKEKGCAGGFQRIYIPTPSAGSDPNWCSSSSDVPGCGVPRSGLVRLGLVESAIVASWICNPKGELHTMPHLVFQSHSVGGKPGGYAVEQFDLDRASINT